MHCDRVRKLMEEESRLSAEAAEHVERCASCAQYARHWRLVQAGFRGLAAEAPPDASVGFTARLMRRLEERSGGGRSKETFFEQVGRRFVYATLVLAFLTLLALVLPTSGPLRQPGSAEIMFAQPEVATLQNEPVLGVDGIGAAWTGAVSQTSAVQRGR